MRSLSWFGMGPAIGVGMSNSKSFPGTSRSFRVRALELRVKALREELVDPYTVRLGVAAVKCVAESLAAAEAELAEVLA